MNIFVQFFPLILFFWLSHSYLKKLLIIRVSQCKKKNYVIPAVIILFVIARDRYFFVLNLNKLKFSVSMLMKNNLK